MKKHVILLLFIFQVIAIKAQITETKTGPIIDGYGSYFDIKNADLQLDNNTEYRVIFDIFTDKYKENKVNPLINTVARYLNMHAQQGVPLKNMKVVVILHGRATKSALSNTAYQKLYATENPNSELIAKLKKTNVEIYVCGQSFLFSKYNLNDVSENVNVSLSALTALVEFQNKGYQIINFN